MSQTRTEPPLVYRPQQFRSAITARSDLIELYGLAMNTDRNQANVACNLRLAHGE
jgi:hypothetical protein